jgi:hypothetical protein
VTENAKYMVPIVKWAKWTGDNLAELEEFWADDLARYNATLSVNLTTGDLEATNSFFSGFDVPVAQGTWAYPGKPGGSPESDVFVGYTEIPTTGLMSE